MLFFFFVWSHIVGFFFSFFLFLSFSFPSFLFFFFFLRSRPQDEISNISRISLRKRTQKRTLSASSYTSGLPMPPLPSSLSRGPCVDTEPRAASRPWAPGADGDPRPHQAEGSVEVGDHARAERLHGALGRRGGTCVAHSEPGGPRRRGRRDPTGASGHRAMVLGTSESEQEFRPFPARERRGALRRHLENAVTPAPPHTVLTMLLDHPESGPHPTPPSGGVTQPLGGLGA